MGHYFAHRGRGSLRLSPPLRLLRSEVDFELGPRRATVCIEPSSLAREDLDGLSAWVMVEDGAAQDERRTRARKQLALAYLALRARDVEHVAIIVAPHDQPASVFSYADGEERLGLVDSSAREDKSLEPGMKLLVEFGERDAGRAEREGALLNARCNCSRVPVHLDGFLIAKGWSRIFGNPTLHTREQLSAHVEVPVMLDDQTIGVAGRHLSKRRGSFVRVLVHGVAREDIPLAGDDGFRVIVEADLRRDLSQAKLIRDERFAAVMAAVTSHRPAAPPGRETEPIEQKTAVLQGNRLLYRGGLAIGAITFVIGLFSGQGVLEILGVGLAAVTIFFIDEKPPTSNSK